MFFSNLCDLRNNRHHVDADNTSQVTSRPTSMFLCSFAVAIVLGCSSEDTREVERPNGSPMLAPISTANEGHGDDAKLIQSGETDSNIRPASGLKALVDVGVFTIGSKAPPLDIEHWVSDGHGKFKSVTEFAVGKVYVVEFWATWCQPCISAIPHLAELQKEYAKRGVQIISVGEEDITTVHSFLQRPFPKEPSGSPQTYGELTSNYCLTTDPDGSTKNAYMRPFGQTGIPVCFIVGKTGLVEWIGHPMAMDGPLEKIVSDEWNREEFAEAFSSRQAFGLVVSKAMQLAEDQKADEAAALLEKAKALTTGKERITLDRLSEQLTIMPQFPTKEAALEYSRYLRADDREGAIRELERNIETIAEPLKVRLQFTQMCLLVEAKRDDAAAALLSLIFDKIPNPGLVVFAQTISRRVEKEDVVSSTLLNAGIAAAEKARMADPNRSDTLDPLAQLMFAQGDVDGAIEILKRAMKMDGHSVERIRFLEVLEAARVDRE